jgi:class 3 adenylate cyclase
MLAQVVEVLRRERRVSYRALRRRFDLDEEYLEDLTIEIIQAKQLATDEDNTILVWTGDATPMSVSASERLPLVYTPAHLSENILTTRTALEGERKQVTVLFTDIKGSTELIAGLDPEEARALLAPALCLMMHAVHRYEGTVNQVLDDGIMALFGAPLAHEDHAVRACHTARAMQDALRRYTEEVRHTRSGGTAARRAQLRRRGGARHW